MSYRLTLKRPEDIPPSTPDVGPGPAGGGAIPDPATGNVGDVVLVNPGQDGYELGPAYLIVKDDLGVELAAVSITETGVVLSASTDGTPLGVLQVLVDGNIVLTSGDAEQGQIALGPTGVIGVSSQGLTAFAGDQEGVNATLSMTAAGLLQLSNGAGSGVALVADGTVDVTSNAEINLDPNTNVLINGEIVGTQADFVANGSTVDQLRDALIASGLMAAS